MRRLNHPARLRLFCLLVVYSAVGLTACGDDASSPPSATPASIEIAPSAVLLVEVGDERMLEATVRSADGDALSAHEPLVWTSSDPSVRIEDGLLRADEALGSALITASIGEVRSAPVLAIIAKPSAGVELLTDAQFVTAPELVGDLPSDPEARFELRATVQGSSSKVGDLLMSTGATSFGGRVVALEPVSGGSQITVESVPLNTLFENLKIEVSAPLDALLPTPQVGSDAQSAIAKHVSPLMLGPLDCKTESSISLTDFVFDVDWTFDHSQLDVDYLLVITDNETLAFGVTVLGPFAATFDGNVQVPISISERVSCNTKIIEAPVVTGNGVIGMVSFDAFVRLNLSFEALANTVALRLLLNGDLAGIVRVGFRYDPATEQMEYFKDAEVEDNVIKVVEFDEDLTDSSEVTLKPSLGFGIGTQATLRTAGLVKNFEIAELTGTDAAAHSFATVKRQIDDPSFAASSVAELTAQYTIYRHGMVWMLSWVPGLHILVGLFATDVTLPKVALATQRSPLGTFTAPGATRVGQPATLTVALTSVDYFGSYNVKEVQIYRHQGIGAALTPSLMGVVLPDADGQSDFSWTWTPTDADVGDNLFSAFVVTHDTPTMPFEVAADTVRTVYVEPNAEPAVTLIDTSGQWEAHCRTSVENRGIRIDGEDIDIGIDESIDDRLPEDQPRSYSEPCSSSGSANGIAVSASGQASYEGDVTVDGADLRAASFHFSANGQSEISGFAGHDEDTFDALASFTARGSLGVTFEVHRPVELRVETMFEGTAQNGVLTALRCPGDPPIEYQEYDVPLARVFTIESTGSGSCTFGMSGNIVPEMNLHNTDASAATSGSLEASLTFIEP